MKIKSLPNEYLSWVWWIEKNKKKMIFDDWFSDFSKSDQNWNILPIDIYNGALFTG